MFKLNKLLSILNTNQGATLNKNWVEQLLSTADHLAKTPVP